MKNKLWLLPYMAITLVLCLLASSLGGRALWTDEMLSVFSSRMSVGELLSLTHLKLYDGMPPLGYILMRPLQLVFGIEVGANIFAACCAMIIAGMVLQTICHIIGKRPHPMIAIMVVTSPFLVWHGSEVRVYSLLAFWGSIIMYHLVVYKNNRGLKACIYLALLGLFFVNSIYSGIFIWVFLAGIVLCYVWVTDGFKKMMRLVPVFLAPVLVSLPFYVMAMRAQQHLGTKAGITKEALMGVIPNVTKYVVEMFPSLLGGWWIYGVILILGVYYLLRKQMKYDALILVTLIVAIIPFLCYAMLRQYLVPASRYWFYASSPVLVLLGLGIHCLLSEIRKPGLARILGYGIVGLMLTTNTIAVLSIISLDGRTAPYRKMQAYIEALPKDRTVISMNYYDNRFLGGYYPIPNDGSRLSPAAYEEGADARVKGTRKILQLVPDALVYVGSDEWQQERQRAGSVTDSGYVYQTPKILELSHRLRLYPEPTGKPYPIALYHETRESLALKADASGVPLSVPGSGFKTINFRNPQGELFFGLSSLAQIQFDIYIPQKMQAQSCELQLVSVSYRSSGLQGGLDGLSLPVLAQQLSITEAQGYYIPQKKQFKGLPSPDYLVQDGMNFVLAMNPQAINIPLGALAPGWHTVTLTTTQKSPWIILSHACVASIARP